MRDMCLPRHRRFNNSPKVAQLADREPGCDRSTARALDHCGAAAPNVFHDQRRLSRAAGGPVCQQRASWPAPLWPRPQASEVCEDLSGQSTSGPCGSQASPHPAEASGPFSPGGRSAGWETVTAHCVGVPAGGALEQESHCGPSDLTLLSSLSHRTSAGEARGTMAFTRSADGCALGGATTYMEPRLGTRLWLSGQVKPGPPAQAHGGSSSQSCGRVGSRAQELGALGTGHGHQGAAAQGCAGQGHHTAESSRWAQREPQSASYPQT